MYYATGNSSYLKFATTPGIAKHAGAFRGSPNYGSFESFEIVPESWISICGSVTFISQSDQHNYVLLASYLPIFTSFNRTRGK
ncbi:hypothetical protein Ahy_B01g056244 [Arachis hypogaea]|uniref:Uncharacterized protein n=1 Tax=Arachis hypogaea TaxID=3818 RepID=A0A445AYE0_ARAHY|nr:hypothetical protein Ahy_B01g056244 [Arachis hypogaea]